MEQKNAVFISYLHKNKEKKWVSKDTPIIEQYQQKEDRQHGENIIINKNNNQAI